MFSSLLLFALCIWFAYRYLAPRPANTTRYSPPEVARIVAEQLLPMQAGSGLHARHEAEPQVDFVFLKRRDTGTLQQDILFAMSDASGQEERFEQMVEAVRTVGIPMNVKPTSGRDGSSQMLLVFLYGGAERLKADVERLVKAVSTVAGNEEEVRYKVVAQGSTDPNIRRRLEAVEIN